MYVLPLVDHEEAGKEDICESKSMGSMSIGRVWIEYTSIVALFPMEPLPALNTSGLTISLKPSLSRFQILSRSFGNKDEVLYTALELYT